MPSGRSSQLLLTMWKRRRMTRLQLQGLSRKRALFRWTHNLLPLLRFVGLFLVTLGGHLAKPAQARCGNMFSPSLLVKLVSIVLNPPSLVMSFAGTVEKSRKLPSRSSSVSDLNLEEESQWKVERAREERLALKQQAQLAAAKCAPTQAVSSVDQGAVPEDTTNAEMPEPGIEESLDKMLEQDLPGAMPSSE